MKIKTDDGQEITVQFADSFFEDFDGTPEEMEEMLAIFVEKLKDGSLFDEAEPVMIEELDEDEADEIMASLETEKKKYTLQ